MYDLIGWRVTLVVIISVICLGFAAFSISAGHETEEDDRLEIPPERSKADMAFMDATFACSAPSPTPLSCGVERWSVKTGTDAGAGSVNIGSASPTTVSALHALPSPSPIPANSRVPPGETTQWVINGTLQKYKLENDSDYHLVVQDGIGNTIITEIPYPGTSPACVAALSPFLPGIAGSRCKFDGSGLPQAITFFQTANIPVRIVGVGMFDFAHGQTGVSPNGIEIHAILDIVFPKTTTAATNVGDNVNITAGDASMTIPSVFVAGTTTSSPIDPSASGPPPASQTLVGPAYTLSTTAGVTGPISICFSVPYITDDAAFGRLQILDLEGGALVNQTTGINPSQKTVCASLPSLSKVVVSLGTEQTPLAAFSVAGRVLTAGGRGVRNAMATISNNRTGVVQSATTGPYGQYRFSGITPSDSYTITIASRRFVFGQRQIFVNGNLTNIDLVSTS